MLTRRVQEVSRRLVSVCCGPTSRHWSAQVGALVVAVRTRHVRAGGRGVRGDEPPDLRGTEAASPWLSNKNSCSVDVRQQQQQKNTRARRENISDYEQGEKRFFSSLFNSRIMRAISKTSLRLFLLVGAHIRVAVICPSCVPG